MNWNSQNPIFNLSSNAAAAIPSRKFQTDNGKILSLDGLRFIFKNQLLCLVIIHQFQLII